ncbi:hypothetical protein, partial [uncultured Helicobacter sp.]|uniref:hypothetical protein n=1 Tax=uncultured Helicobacter sp. TaxID=175537 RepID=UPI003752E2B7
LFYHKKIQKGTKTCETPAIPCPRFYHKKIQKGTKTVIVGGEKAYKFYHKKIQKWGLRDMRLGGI